MAGFAPKLKGRRRHAHGAPHPGEPRLCAGHRLALRGRSSRAVAAARRNPGPAYTLFAPEHYGCERTGPWTGTHAFTLADEAARTIDSSASSRDRRGDGALLSAGAVVTYHCQAAGFAITFNAGKGQMKIRMPVHQTLGSKQFSGPKMCKIELSKE